MTAALLLAAAFAGELPPRSIIAVSGGASRGAYQAGALYALLHAGVGEARIDLPGFTGTSTGAINALLGALEACSLDQPLTPDDSLLWELWRELSWSSMFPGDLSCSEYRAKFPWLEVTCGPDGEAFGPGDGMITASSMSALRHRLRDLLAETERYRACTIPLTLSVTAEKPAHLRLGNYQVSTSRRMVGVELRTTAIDRTPRPRIRPRLAAIDTTPHVQPRRVLEICQVALGPLPGDSAPGGIPGEDADDSQRQRLVLPTRSDGQACPGDRVDPELFLDVVFASAAEPPYLPSVEISYCAIDSCPGAEARDISCPSETHGCKGRFLDGSAFDKQPLYAALAQGHARSREPARQSGGSAEARPAMPLPQIIMLTPNQPVDPAANAPAQPRVHPRGFAHYRQTLDNFVSVAGHYELQTLQRYGEVTADLRLVEQSRALVADLQVFDDSRLLGGVFSGMASFFDLDFRRHDYYLGIHDGLRWLHRWLAKACPSCDPSDLWSELLESARVGKAPGLGFVVHSADAERTVPWIGCQVSGAAITSIREELKQEAAARRQAERVAAVSCALDKAVIAEGGLLLPWGDSARDSDQFGLFAEALSTPMALPGTRSFEFDPDHALPYVEGYRTWRYDLLRQAFRRLGEVERQDGGRYASWFALGEYGAAVAASTWRDGFTLGSGTIPQRIRQNELLSTMEKMLLPATVRFRGRGRYLGFESLLGSPGPPGSKPGIELAWDAAAFHFGAPDRPSSAELRHHLETQIALTQVFPRDAFPWNVGVSLSYAVDPLVFNYRALVHWLESFPQTGVRLRYSLAGSDLPHDTIDGSGRPWAVDVFTRPFLGRIEIGLRWPHLGEDTWNFYFGIDDLNGLVYWALRGLTGSDDAYHGITDAALQKAPSLMEGL